VPLGVLPQFCASFTRTEAEVEKNLYRLKFLFGHVIVHLLAILELLCFSRGVEKFSFLPLRHLGLAAVCGSRYHSLSTTMGDIALALTGRDRHRAVSCSCGCEIG
jgi:hypothetical protein